MNEDPNHHGDPAHCSICHERRGVADEKAVLVDRLGAANMALLRLTPNLAECVARFADEGDEVSKLVTAEYEKLYTDWRIVGIEASTLIAEFSEQDPRT